MWIIYALLSSFLGAIINWLDEYLTAKSPFTGNDSVNQKVGSLLLVSTLFSIVGVISLYLGIDSISVGIFPIILSLFASITTVVMWGAYFYLLNKYPVYQVIPLYQLISIWLLVFEVIFGGQIAMIGLIGILLLVIGAYLIDVGEVKWSIPSSLLISMIGITFIYSSGVYAIRIASKLSNPWVVSFWQYTGIVGLGILTFISVAVFRKAFIFRIKNQGKVFIGISSISETLSQIAYVFRNYAVALAPISAYATAMGSIQSLFVLILFYFFPQKKMTINRVQVFAILIMILGAVLLEIGK